MVGTTPRATVERFYGCLSSAPPAEGLRALCLPGALIVFGSREGKFEDWLPVEELILSLRAEPPMNWRLVSDSVRTLDGSAHVEGEYEVYLRTGDQRMMGRATSSVHLVRISAGWFIVSAAHGQPTGAASVSS